MQAWLDETCPRQHVSDVRNRKAPTLPLLATLLALAPQAAPAAPQTLPLDPSRAEVQFRAYAFGLLPIDGVFSRFSGTLTVDPQVPAACHVEISVAVASLTMSNEAIRRDVLSAAMLDAARFPTLDYNGACQEHVITGTLTLHGATHPLQLAISNVQGRYSAEAALRRADWGILGRPLIAGQTVRIRVSTTISR